MKGGVIFVLLVALYIIKRRRRWHPPNVPLPPGPRSFPLLGAALSIDASKPWFTYFVWRKSFGDLIYTRIFHMDVLIINSVKVARDLLDHRSNIYSDRPRFATTEPYGIADGTILLPYGDTWRLHRRIYHQALNSEAAAKYRPMQCAKARQLIVNLAEDPRHYSAHLHTYSTSIIMSIVYGYDTAPTNDPYVEYAEQGVKAISKATDPKGAALLAMFPFLLKLPTWMPGSFKAEAALAMYYATGFRKVLFGMALERIATGVGTPSMISDAVKKNEINGNLSEVTLAIRNTSAVAYGGRYLWRIYCSTLAHTSMQLRRKHLNVFVLAMVLFPEAQKRAQKEIDTVVGSDRLPNFSDRPSLPFVEAVLRETFRWYPAAPLALPRATTNEDVYEGSYIPKGPGIGHDEQTYPEPFKFNPERFIKEDGTLTEEDFPFGFGFGRRICPGRHVADASMWIAIASMLATLDFLKAKDDHGNEIDFSPEFISGPTSRPKPFPCRIVPRMSPSTINGLTMQDI
ncbi:cytochrome P450 [Boletus reticuloceps]|uniref:Cytochrome P450 n=1 Tax=Boletus reticuloceps TaxID=495285 RepID=A0A8I3A9T4_9AGAM|nr:cytochrome P450 [Boletus reticuloceps]